MIAGAVADVLAVNNFGDTSDANGLAGPIALLVVLVLAAATIVLIRSMNGHLRRLPERFPSAGPSAGPAGAAQGAGDAGSAANPAGSVARAAAEEPAGGAAGDDLR